MDFHFKVFSLNIYKLGSNRQLKVRIGSDNILDESYIDPKCLYLN